MNARKCTNILIISFLGLKAAVPHLTYEAQTHLSTSGTETPKKGYLVSIDELPEVTDVFSFTSFRDDL